MPIRNKSLKEIASGYKKIRRALLFGMVFMIGSLLFSFFFGEMGLVHFFKMKRVRQELHHELKTLETENSRLLGEIEALKTDLFYIETLARDRLGFVREGERVYEFVDG